MRVLNLKANPFNPRILSELTFRITLADAEVLADAPLALIKHQVQRTREGALATYRGAGVWAFRGRNAGAVYHRALIEMTCGLAR